MKKFLFAIAFLISSLVWAAPDWINAKVVKVEPERNRIVLNHEKIKSIGMDAMTMLFDTSPKIKSIGMDAMTMLFDTSPKLDLKSYKVGDSVRFQFKINDGVLEVIALEKMP